MVENTSEDTAQDTNEHPWWKAALSNLPLGDLKAEATNYAKAYAEKGASSLTDTLNGLTEKFTPDGGGASQEGLKKGAEKLAEGKNPASAGASALAAGAKEKLTGGSSGGGSGGSANLKKFSNIVGSIDVGVPITVAYNQWTQYEDWPDFMKKVENAEQEEPEQEGAAEVEIKGKVLFSHRTWNSTVIQQVPDEQIVWESKGEKGHLDGAVTFHELGPRLTRILVIVNYYPQGFVEKFGNAWRPVGRRIHLNMKQFARHVMTTTILDEDAVDGWRGEVRDKEVVRTHEEVVEAEQAEADESEEPNEQEESASQDVDSPNDPGSDAEDEVSDADPDTEQDDDSEDGPATAGEENLDEVTDPSDAGEESLDEDTESSDAGEESLDEDTESSSEGAEDDAAPSDEESDEPEDDEDFVYVDEDSDTTKGTS